MDDRSRPPLGLRLLADAQRLPWAGAFLAVPGAYTVLALPLGLLATRLESRGPRFAIGVVAAAFGAHVVAESPSWVGRAAALVMANAAVLLYGLGDVVLAPRRAADALVPPAAAAFAVGWALVAAPRPPRARGRLLLEALAVAALALAASLPLDAGSPATVGALLALPVVLGAFVASGSPAGHLLAGGAGLGIALAGVHLVVAVQRAPFAGRIVSTLAGAALAGALFAALGVAARAARSFTAVPRDHPSVEEFEEGRPREAP